MNNTIMGKMVKLAFWVIISTSIILNTLELTWIALELIFSSTEQITFESSSRDSAIYLRHDYYGVTSDSDVLIISPELRRHVIPNAMTDFYGKHVGQHVFYSFKNDTLFLHVEEVMPVPVVAPLEIVVVQRKLRYPDIYEMRKQGLVEEL